MMYYLIKVKLAHHWPVSDIRIETFTEALKHSEECFKLYSPITNLDIFECDTSRDVSKQIVSMRTVR